MAEVCLKRFKVAIEVEDFTCYIKYVDKQNDSIPGDLVDDLYELIKNKKTIRKRDISKIVSLHVHHLTPSMLKEDKFNFYYDAITESFIKDIDNLSDHHDTPFVINLETDLSNRFNKEEFINHFTDMYLNSLFLLDLRYYGVKKKYYEVPFELRLNENGLTVSSENPLFIRYFLDKYEINNIVDVLGIRPEINYKGNILSHDGMNNANIDNVFPYDSEVIRECLVNSFLTSHCIFINNVFLKSLDIEVADIIKSSDEPKLLILFEDNNYHYFNQHNNCETDRIENINNNIIIHISENLFRETIGNASYIITMTDKIHLTINQLGSEYLQFPFIAKCQNKNLNLFSNILEKFFGNKKIESYMDYLLLLSFVLDGKDINSNLNYYLVNKLKTSNISHIRFNNTDRESLTFIDMKKLLNIFRLTKKLDKKIIIYESNVKLLLNDCMIMIRKLCDLDSIAQYEKVLDDIISEINLDKGLFENDINQIRTIINLKRIVLTKEKDINFIIDTSVLIEEPDLFHKYFNNKFIVVHSIIKDELEKYRGSNINAVRAIRNINLLKNDTKINIQFIHGDNLGEITRSLKEKVLEDLMNQFNHLGKRPVLVSNDNCQDLYKKNRDNIIQLQHIPLLF